MGDGDRKRFEDFRLEVDPEKVEEAVRRIREHAESLRDRLEAGLHGARFTKVRVSVRGRQIGPDIPLSVFLAGEGVALATLGPIATLVTNLGGAAFLTIEFVHDADELVAAGREAFGHGEVETAEARYREALERRRDDPSALYHLGVLLRVTGRHDEALRCFRSAAMGPEGHPDVVRAAEAIERMGGKRTL